MRQLAPGGVEDGVDGFGGADLGPPVGLKGKCGQAAFGDVSG